MTNFADMVGPCICIWCNSPDVKVNCKRIWYCPLWSARGFKTFCYLKLSCSCHWMHIKQCIALSYGKKNKLCRNAIFILNFILFSTRNKSWDMALLQKMRIVAERVLWLHLLLSTNYLIACGHFFTSSIVATFFCFVLLC